MSIKHNDIEKMLYDLIVFKSGFLEHLKCMMISFYILRLLDKRITMFYYNLYSYKWIGNNFKSYFRIEFLWMTIEDVLFIQRHTN